MLLNHLFTADAARHGVSIQAEAVTNDKHTFYLIAETCDEEQRNQFLAPLASETASSASCHDLLRAGLPGDPRRRPSCRDPGWERSGRDAQEERAQHRRRGKPFP
jgi:hypothetical protein